MRQQLAYDTDLEAMCHDFAVIVDTEVLELERWIKRAAKESAANFINELEKKISKPAHTCHQPMANAGADAYQHLLSVHYQHHP